MFIFCGMRVGACRLSRISRRTSVRRSPRWQCSSCSMRSTTLPTPGTLSGGDPRHSMAQYEILDCQDPLEGADPKAHSLYLQLSHRILYPTMYMERAGAGLFSQSLRIGVGRYLDSLVADRFSSYRPAATQADRQLQRQEPPVPGLRDARHELVRTTEAEPVPRPSAQPHQVRCPIAVSNPHACIFPQSTHLRSSACGKLGDASAPHLSES